jgi:aryl-alcohol dehydrogenase-like predicted oxidoreductase
MGDASLQSLAGDKFPVLIMGGSGFSYQVTKDPESLNVVSILRKAFDLGLRAIDTSPYYEPSEQLMGHALNQPEITSKYKRGDYMLMTKVGRILIDKFDYSPEWIEKSVARSLTRFQTTYLDVVFCHDVEFVTLEEAITAVGTLFKLRDAGHLKYVGISGYDIPALARVAEGALARYGRSIDIVQNWAQLTLQNTKLEQNGIRLFKDAGVSCICNSSPLGSGLLRNGGVPLGALGDWHPAPPGLRAISQDAAMWVESQGESLSALALRFAISRAWRASRNGVHTSTIIGVGAMSDLEENISTAKTILRTETGSAFEDSASLDNFRYLNEDREARDTPLYAEVQKMMGSWLDFDFSVGQQTSA